MEMIADVRTSYNTNTVCILKEGMDMEDNRYLVVHQGASRFFNFCRQIQLSPFSVIYWGSSIRASESRKLNKTDKRADSCQPQ